MCVLDRRRHTVTCLSNSSGSTAEPHQCVGVHEDAFGVVRERPAVEFGEGDPKVGPLHHGQVCRVAAVEDVHHPHLVKDHPQHTPKEMKNKNKVTLCTLR